MTIICEYDKIITSKLSQIWARTALLLNHDFLWYLGINSKKPPTTECVTPQWNRSVPTSMAKMTA